MKKIFLVLTIAAFLTACTNEEKKQSTRLPGEFKYTAYNWNESGDSLGISLLHYLQIAEDGNYRLIQRNADGNAVYYYGFIGYDQVAELRKFMADSSLNSNYIDSTDNGTRYIFDYVNNSGEHRVKFTSALAPESIKNTQVKFDSIINSPGKKTSSFFNIDNYLRQIIAEDSATRVKE